MVWKVRTVISKDLKIKDVTDVKKIADLNRLIRIAE